MRVEAYESLDDVPAALPLAWNSLLPPDRVTEGVDATASVEWHVSLMEAFLGDGGARLLVAYDDNARIAGLLPLYQVKSTDSRPVRGRIATWSELYCGRCGLMINDRSDRVLERLLSHIDSAFPNWRSLEVTLSDGNGEIDLLMRAIGDRCLSIVSEPLEPSPYIALPERFDDYFKSLKSSFRTEVGRRTRRLTGQGAVARRLFSACEDVGPLWDAVCAIERQSWKEAAGTSITTNPVQARFYEALLPRAAAAGQLLSTVLYLDGRPIAHQLNLRRDTTVTSLKASYVEDLRGLHPAAVLMVGHIGDIIERGLRYFDFMGDCDEFKMRWTDLTYGRTRYVLYRRSVGGRIALWRRTVSQRITRFVGRKPKSSA